MNSLASTKCAQRIVAVLALTTGLFFSAGCGSNSNGFAPSNPEGFGNSSLTGTYVFSSSGEDSTTGAPIEVAGTLIANGSGTIRSGGMIDIVDLGFTSEPTPIAQPITGGSYSVGTDGRGRVSLVTSTYGTYTFDFVLTSNSHGLFTEFDNNGTGSGTIDLQAAVPSVSPGAYAFSLGGLASNDAPFAGVGAFTLNSSGASVAGSGVADFNAGGVPYPDQTLSASLTVGSGAGPGTLSLTTTTFPLTFDVYAIDSTHWKVIETDGTQFLSGDVFSQASATIPSGPMVFTMAGGTTTPIAIGGLMNSTGGGSFTGGLEDYNSGGNVATGQAFTATAATGPGIGGRVVVNLTGFTPATQWVIYPSSAGYIILEIDAADVTIGTAFVQSATSLGAGAYGLNLSGTNGFSFGGSEVDDIAQFNLTGTTIKGALDENDVGNLALAVPLTGSITADSTADGRGVLNATAVGTYLGGATLQYYVVDSSNVLFIEEDQGQIATGTFELQSTTSSQTAAQSHMALVRTAKPHAASKRKLK